VNCLVTEEQLALFLSGDLDGPDQSRVSAHLTECSDCRQRIIDFERASRLLLGAFDEPDARDLFALRAAVQSAVESPTRLSVWHWLPAIALLMFAVLLLPLVQHREPPAPELPFQNLPVQYYRVHVNLNLPTNALGRRKGSRRAPSIQAGLRNAELTTTAQGKSELLVATADPNVLILLPMDNAHDN
jgi:anti-sigma factor RsiW